MSVRLSVIFWFACPRALASPLLLLVPLRAAKSHSAEIRTATLMEFMLLPEGVVCVLLLRSGAIKFGYTFHLTEHTLLEEDREVRHFNLSGATSRSS